MTRTLTPAMYRALRRAAKRERGNICPIVGVHAAAEKALLDAMERRGFIEYRGPCPVITKIARGAVLAAEQFGRKS